MTDVADGDRAHAEAVVSQLDLLSVSLHAHHESEDARLWGTLTDRSPSCAAHVDRMKEEHAQMLVHLEELDAALPVWRASAEPGDAAAVLAALGGSTRRSASTCPTRRRTSSPSWRRS